MCPVVAFLNANSDGKTGLFRVAYLLILKIEYLGYTAWAAGGETCKSSLSLTWILTPLKFCSFLYLELNTGLASKWYVGGYNAGSRLFEAVKCRGS
jgi:hypothetical protein